MSSGVERLGSTSPIFYNLFPQARKEELKEAPDGQAGYWCAGGLFEALDLAVRGTGGDAGRSNKKLTVSDALVVARSPQGMRGMYTNCILRNVRRIPAPSTLYIFNVIPVHKGVDGEDREDGHFRNTRVSERVLGHVPTHQSPYFRVSLV